MTLTPWDLDGYSNKYADMYSVVEDAIINEIISALQFDYSSDWSAIALSKTIPIQKRAQALLMALQAKISSNVKQDINTASLINIKQAEEWLSEFAEQGKLNQPTSLENDREVKNIVAKSQIDAKDYLSLISRNMSQNAADKFRKIVSDAMIFSKNMPVNEAISKAMLKTSDTGIPALIDRAGRRWNPTDYIRGTIDTAINNASNEVEMARYREYGNLIKISQHAGARPHCAPYQGRIYDLDGKSDKYPAFSSTSYGDIAGILGRNCKHYLMPYVPGQTTPDWHIDDEENARVYKLSQQQRYLERQIREAKRRLKISKSFDDKANTAKSRELLANRQARMREFIKRNKLTRQYKREQVTNIPKSAYNKAKEEIEARSKINIQKFNRHVPGTDEYKQYLNNRVSKGKTPPSELTIDSKEAQNIINKYGVSDNTSRNSIFKLEKILGIFIDIKTGERIPTKYGIITYSKTGAHITPLDPRGR